MNFVASLPPSPPSLSLSPSIHPYPSLPPLPLSLPLQFNPELVIVSCGFDAGMGDHLGGYHVSPAGFAHMTHLLMSLAKGKLVLALEGGEGSTLVLLLQDCLQCEKTNLNLLTHFDTLFFYCSLFTLSKQKIPCWSLLKAKRLKLNVTQVICQITNTVAINFKKQWILMDWCCKHSAISSTVQLTCKPTPS